jgi:hypothetical protein
MIQRARARNVEKTLAQLFWFVQRIRGNVPLIVELLNEFKRVKLVKASWERSISTHATVPSQADKDEYYVMGLPGMK